MEIQHKADLHLHLDGSLPVSLLEEFAKEEGKSWNQKEIERQVTVPKNCASLSEYLRCFDVVLPFMQTEDRLCRGTYHLVKTLEAEGLDYVEIRFAPQLHGQKGMSQQRAVEAAAAGIEKAQREGCRLKAGLLLCMMVTGTEKENRETVELAIACHNRGVAGLDLAGAEGAAPMERFRELFLRASKANLPFTIHAGECGDEENIRRAVSFGARRIGHGCAAALSKECMELLRKEKIVIESCPTSNLQTKAVEGISSHPIRLFWEEGLLVTVNTDNRTVSGTTLEQEYDLLKNHLGFTRQDICRMNEIAWQARFLQ